MKKHSKHFVWMAVLLMFVGSAAWAADGMVDSSKYKKAPPYVVGLSNVSPANAFKVAMVF